MLAARFAPGNHLGGFYQEAQRPIKGQREKGLGKDHAFLALSLKKETHLPGGLRVSFTVS